jgi:hypothetical protein
MLRSHETIAKSVVTRSVNVSVYISEEQKTSRLKLYTVLIVAFLAIAIGGWWMLYNAIQVSTEDFGIYLLETNEVIVTGENILSYKKTFHEVVLTEKGANNIEKLGLKVPLNGTKFVIKINGKEIYDGWFWSPISSIPCSGIVIETLIRNNTLKIETGYPSSHFQGEDPRNNPDVFNYFQAVGKLVD